MNLKLQVSLLLSLFGVLGVTSVSLAEDRMPKSATQELIDEINGASSTTQPGVQVQSSGGSADDSNATDWLRLLRLFAPALVTAAALGIAAGVLGVFVLLRREALVALAIPQIVAIGAAIGLRMGWPTLPPAMLTAAIGLAYFVQSRQHGGGIGLLPALYIGGLSISFLIIANKGQEVEDLQNLFVGVDVAVTTERAILAAPILLFAAAACAVLWRRWLLLAQAPSAGELAGISPTRWNALFLLLLTIALLLGTDSLGVVMVLTMLFLPAAAVLPWAKRIPGALAASGTIAILFLAVGFYLSNRMSWPLSQSIGGVGFLVMLMSHLLARVRSRG